MCTALLLACLLRLLCAHVLYTNLSTEAELDYDAAKQVIIILLLLLLLLYSV